MRYLKNLPVRLNYAETIAAGQKERLDRGEGNVLEYNNVQLNLSSIKGEVSRVRTERNAIVAQLSRPQWGCRIGIR